MTHQQLLKYQQMLPHMTLVPFCCRNIKITGSQWYNYASHTLTETEKHYAQTEIEGLALTLACDKFSPYIIGKTIELETDHKPLVLLLSSKNLDAIPPYILRF